MRIEKLWNKLCRQTLRGHSGDRRTGACAVVLGAALGGLLAIAPIPPAGADEPVRGGTLVIGHNSLRHLNPAVQSGNATGVPGTQIFAGLIQLDDKFNVLPYLAKSWEMSSDGLSYTFHLEENTTFHDGKPVTSADVAFSLGVVKNNHPFGVAMFAAVKEVETPDPHTVVIKLSDPHPALLSALSPVLMPVLPKHVYDDGQDIKKHPANSAPVGSGPFKFVEWKKGQHVILARNENFFRPNRPYLDRIILKIYKDATTRRLALERGDIQYAAFAGVRVASIPKLKALADLDVTIRGYGALGPTNYLEFNHRKKPMSDVRFRKAIAHAIDRDFITQKLHAGVSTPLEGPFHHTSPWYSPDDLVNYDYDLEKAKRLLDEAGLKPDANGIRASLTLDLPTFHPDSSKTVGEYLKPQLAKIGIAITLRNNPDFATWSRRVSNWEYELSMNAIWNYPDPVIGVHRAYLCTNQKKGVIWSNTEGYCNKRVDEVLNQAAVATDFATRKALYAEFQRIVTEELPFTWTNEEPYVTIYNKKVKNLPMSVWGAMQPMDEVYLAQ